ncbi:MAG: hypothetical protein ABIJ09_11870 [Pseudomonadota bacterium]
MAGARVSSAPSLDKGWLAQLARWDSADWYREDRVIRRNEHLKLCTPNGSSVLCLTGIPAPGAKSNRKRIVVLGDSFVEAGGYLNANNLWWRQLQRELEHRGYWSVDVVAMGHEGMATQDQLEWLRRGEVRELLPDLILIGYVENDPIMVGEDKQALVLQQWNVLFLTGIPPTHPRLRGVQVVLEPLSWIAPRATALVRARVTRKLFDEGTPTDGYPYDLWTLKILEGENFERYRLMLHEFRKQLDAHAVPAFFMTLPTTPDREHNQARFGAVDEAFRAARLPYHDISDRFSEVYDLGPNPLAWGANPANGHPGPVATHFYAQQAADILEGEFREVLGPRTEIPTDLVPKINDWVPVDVAPRQEGPGTWWLHFAPGDVDHLPSLELGAPFLSLHFERPVAIKSVRLSGAQLSSAELYFTATDAAGVDHRVVHRATRRAGPDLSWSLEEPSLANAINTLRVVPRLDPQVAGTRVLEVDPNQIQHVAGHAYTVEFDDVVETQHFALREDSTWLWQGQEKQMRIADGGAGRYALRDRTLTFSSTDGSDPRLAVHRYRLECVEFKLDIEYAPQAVRP